MKNCLLILCLLMLGQVAMTNSPIRIWDGTKVNEKNVTLTPYIADSSNNTGIAVVVCPGGSYFWNAYKTEGVEVAKWLQSNGISAFVLRYRSAGWLAFMTHYRVMFHGHQFPDMIQDLQRAIQIVRSNAKEYGIDVDKLGVMGFSAGGHLVMSSNLFYNHNFLENLNIDVNVSLRPNFTAAIYPVVTFTDKRYVHKRSMRGLLGDNSKVRKAYADSLSLERHVSQDMTPVFLVNCVDDPIVKYQNSVLLDSALTANKVEHKYIQYKTGGHGFGVNKSKTTDEAIMWKKEFLLWLKDLW